MPLTVFAVTLMFIVLSLTNTTIIKKAPKRVFFEAIMVNLSNQIKPILNTLTSGF